MLYEMDLSPFIMREILVKKKTDFLINYIKKTYTYDI